MRQNMAILLYALDSDVKIGDVSLDCSSVVVPFPEHCTCPLRVRKSLAGRMWEGRDSPEQTWDPYLRINLLDHSPGVMALQ